MQIEAQTKPKKSKLSYRNYIIAGFISVILLVIGFGGWGMIALISGAVIGQGVIVVEGNPKDVQHLDGGIVDKIHYQDGDLVQKSAVILSLDDTSLNTELTTINQKLAELIINQKSLQAERDGKDVFDLDLSSIPQSANKAEILKSQAKLLKAKTALYEAQIEQYNKQIKQNDELIEGLKSLQITKKAQLDIINEELTSMQTLAKGGHAAKVKVSAKKKEALEVEGDINNRLHEIARLKATNHTIKVQIIQLKQNNLEKILSELKQTESSISELNQDKIAIEDKLNRIDIKSPITGIVHNSLVHTKGGVVTPATVLMQIIPMDQKLKIETRLEPMHIDQVHLGQEAKVLLSAFNQKTTPELMGKVEKIAPNILQDQNTGMQFYKIMVTIEEAELKKLNGQQLIPGMPAEVFIKTNDRTAMNYLLKPLLDQINRAFREE